MHTGPGSQRSIPPPLALPGPAQPIVLPFD
jgi:hypothetical protein